MAWSSMTVTMRAEVRLLDCFIQLDRTCFRADRALIEAGFVFTSMTPGAVMLLWPANTAHHLWNLRFHKGCRPYCLLREFVVYIPPTSNNNRSEALKELSHCISEQQTSHPDVFVILAGEFNHAGPKAVFPKIHQHIDLPTRGNNTMDHVYTTQRGAYKAFPLPHFVLQTTLLC